MTSRSSYENSFWSRFSLLAFLISGVSSSSMNSESPAELDPEPALLSKLARMDWTASWLDAGWVARPSLKSVMTFHLARMSSGLRGRSLGNAKLR